MTRATALLIRFGVLAAVLAGTGNIAATETLRAGGIGAATNVLPHLFAAFERGEAVKLQVVPSLGTNGGLRALGDGVLDMAVAGRPLKPEEIAQGLRPALAVRTPFVLVTSHREPHGLRAAELASLYASSRASWPDGSLIRIILRPRTDSDTAALGGMFPGMAGAIEKARERDDIPYTATDQDNVELAERTPGSLATSTLTQVRMERRSLRLVPIDGVAPSLESLESGAYPFAKTLYFVLPAKGRAAAEGFVAFLRSPAGQAALRATGNLLMAEQGGVAK